MALTCQSMGSKQKIFLVIAVVNLVILAIYQGFFSQVYSALDLSGNVDHATQDKIRSFVISGGEQQTVFDVDIHYEDPVLGHTGKVSIGHVHNLTQNGDQRKTIAIGGGITSKGLRGLSAGNIETKFQFFFTLLPSFCRTASSSHHYHFYLAYDQKDSFFNNINNLQAFTASFKKTCNKLCPNIKSSMHLVQCDHNARPAWAQNDAMFEAYIDEMEYYYRVNDDSDLSSAGWTEAFISTLASYKPKNVGVVGPKHRGGNEAILTYDFVHKTHVDIFGFYYPRLFTDWWADDWVTKVYQPGRSTKLPNIRLVHTMKLGQRYKLQSSQTGSKLAGQLAVDKVTLQRYIKYAQERESAEFPKADGSKVISMSLFGKDPRHTYGALRNAQILPIHFPGWTLRIYTAGPKASKDLQVPVRILNKLKSLGVQVALVNLQESTIPPQTWRYFVADDKKVEKFLVRDVDARLSDQEYKAVQAWEASAATFHCIKDHPKQALTPIVDGLWGAKSENLRKLLTFSMKEALFKNLSGLNNIFNTTSSGTFTHLQSVIWPLVQAYAICHDSVSCDKWKHSRPFPEPRHGKSYIGQKYDSHMNPEVQDVGDLVNAPKQCTGKWQGEEDFPPLPTDSTSKLPDNGSLSAGSSVSPTSVTNGSNSDIKIQNSPSNPSKITEKDNKASAKSGENLTTPVKPSDKSASNKTATATNNVPPPPGSTLNNTITSQKTTR